MKKIISILLSFVICFSSVAIFAADETSTLPRIEKYGEGESIGRGSWNFATHGYAVCYDREGNPQFCFNGQGGYFLVYDLVTGKKVHEFNHNGVSAQGGGGYIYTYAMATGADNKVYAYTYHGDAWSVYDPINGTFERAEALVDGVDMYTLCGQPRGGTSTEDGKFYIGTYKQGGAHLWEYDIYTGETTDHGVPYEPADYMNGVAVTDKYIHLGFGTGQEVVRCMRIDRKTGERKEYLVQPGGGIIYGMRVKNGIVAAYHYGVIDFVDEESLEKIWRVSGSVNSAIDCFSPFEGEEHVVYANSGSNIYRHDIDKKESTLVCENGVTVKGWAEMPNGDWVIAGLSGTNVGWSNPKTGETKMFPYEVPDTGPAVQGIGISPDNIIYIGGYQSSFGAYNIDDGEFIFSLPKWEQNEGTGFLNGKVYLGVYTDAYICRYDPEKPMNFVHYNFDTNYQGPDVNPSMVYDIEDNQDRAFVVKGYKDKLYVGSHPGYSKAGGALTIYEEDEEGNPKGKTFKDIIPGQAIPGVAVKDNLVYVSGSTWVGLGGDKVETQAKMAVFDTNTEKVVVEPFVPDLPELGDDNEGIGELSFGPDGLLWGVTNKWGMFFAMDPETFEVKKYTILNPGEVNGAYTRPSYIRWGDDGIAYITAAWNSYMVDPETMESKKIIPSVQLMDLDVDGNVWYSKGGATACLKINQYDRLQRFLKINEKLSSAGYTAEEWAVLSEELKKAKTYTEETDFDTIRMTIRKIKAYRDKTYMNNVKENAVKVIIDGEELELNAQTGVSRIHNGRTILPYRALLEKLGYEVKWRVQNETITAKNDEHELKMVMGDNIYVLDGEEVEFDTPPVLLSYKKYIPLRVISEGLGYEVIYDDETKTVTISK